MRVTFLGTGTSRGVPVIGCDCATCRSTDPKNNRLRTSILIEGEKTIVVDTSVDFRQQMLRNRVGRLDAVVYTHSHADHILGLDDVFPYTARSKQPLPIHASAATLQELSLTFRHLFGEKDHPGVAKLAPQEISGPFRIGDLDFIPIEVFHGSMPVLGFRIGNFAYVTDVNMIPEASMEKLRDLQCLVLDGLRYKSHRTHFSVSEALAVAAELKPVQTYLVHMTHDVEHEAASLELPEGTAFAYDGLCLQF